MLESIFAVIFGFFTADLPDHVDPVSFATDMIEVVEAGPKLLNTPEETARLMTTWALKESRLNPNALGDGGASVGLFQLRYVWWGDLKQAEVVCQKTNMKLALKVMSHLKDRCGSVKAGLGAFATGRCGGAPKLVEHRCKLANVNCK